MRGGAGGEGDEVGLRMLLPTAARSERLRLVEPVAVRIGEDHPVDEHLRRRARGDKEGA